MKILSWNIQGGKKPQALSELIYLKNKYRLDIIFVKEKKNDNSKRVLKTLQFHNNIIVELVNHSGGIWVWNNDDITLQT